MSASPLDVAKTSSSRPSLYDVATSRICVTAHVQIADGAMRWFVHLGAPENRVCTGTLGNDTELADFTSNIAEYLEPGQAVMVTSQALGEMLAPRFEWILGHDHAAYAAIESWRSSELALNVTITSDASMRKGHAGAGLGWVVEPHDCDLARIPGHDYLGEITSIDEAELNAALYALHHVARLSKVWRRPLGAITLRSDSQRALARLEELLGSGRAMDCTHLRPQTRRKLHHVMTRIDGLDVTTEWVKGHTGDTHNEAADRLAVAARRSHGLAEEKILMKAVEGRVHDELTKSPAHG